MGQAQFLSNSSDTLASEILNDTFFIEHPAKKSFNRLSRKNTDSINNKQQTHGTKLYIKLIRVPLVVNVDDVYRDLPSHRIELSSQEVIAFCKKYKEWFKNHIRIAYFFTSDGFSIVRDPYRTGMLSTKFYKINALHDLGVGLKSPLAFIITVDWSMLVPH